MSDQNEIPKPLPEEFIAKIVKSGRAGNLPDGQSTSDLKLTPEKMNPIADEARVPESEAMTEAERAQLDTTQKVARSLADKFNNDLTPPMTFLDAVIEDPSLSPHHKAMLSEVMDGLTKAGQRSAELLRMKRFKETQTPGGQPMLDWDKSLNPTPKPTSQPLPKTPLKP